MSRSSFAMVSLFAFGTLINAVTASASLVTLDFTGAGGNNSGGIYVYPYDFTINSSSDTTLLMCDDFNHEIAAPETWTANTLAVPNLDSSTVTGLQYPSAGVPNYLVASYLFLQEVSAYEGGNTDSQGLFNWAVWDLLTGIDESSVLGSSEDATVHSYLSYAEGLTLTASQFSGVVIYTPLPDQTDEPDGLPQEFFGYNPPIVPVPEPSTLALLGIGAVSLLARRRKNIAIHNPA